MATVLLLLYGGAAIVLLISLLPSVAVPLEKLSIGLVIIGLLAGLLAHS